MSVLESVINQLLARHANPQPSDGLVTDIQALVAASPTAYSQVAYAYDANAIAAGALDYLGATASFWYDDPDHPEAGVSAAKVQQYIGTYGDSTTPLLMNIEQWSPVTDYSTWLANLTLAASMWQAQSPRPIGFYHQLPYFDNYDATHLQAAIAGSDETDEAKHRSALSTWQQLYTKSMRDLGNLVDFLVPKCYVLYNGDQTAWKWIVSFQVLEALRIANGKPVYPILWHDAQTDAADLTSAEFTSALQFLAGIPGIAGVFFWSGGDDPAGYNWYDIAGAQVAGTGVFAPPAPP